MTIQNPGDSSERYEAIQKEVLSGQYRLWNALLDSKGEEADHVDDGEYTVEADYAFNIARHQDSESKFVSEKILIEKLAIPVEDYIIPDGVTVPFPKSKPGESWILMTIQPRDIYNPNIVKHNSNDSPYYYYAECLEVFISSNGRAYEASVRREIYEDEIVPEFKDVLNQAGSATQRDMESLVGSFLNGPSPLTGTTLERLMFIAAQANKEDAPQGGDN